MMARKIPEWNTYIDQITNESGFTAYPTGLSNSVSSNAYWWSVEEYRYNQVFVASLPNTNIINDGKETKYKNAALPVRCVKDPPAGD